MDSEAIKKAVADILVAVGEDPTREGLVTTPDRVAELFGELYSGVGVEPVSVLRDATEVPAGESERGEMVAQALVTSGVATGALVLVSAVHGCVAYRGPKQRLTTVTVATAGSFSQENKRHEALLLAGGEDWA